MEIKIEEKHNQFKLILVPLCIKDITQWEKSASTDISSSVPKQKDIVINFNISLSHHFIYIKRNTYVNNLMEVWSLKK